MKKSTGLSPFSSSIRDLLKTPVITISPEASATEAARLMTSASINSLLVMLQGKALGIITSTDLVTKVLVNEENRVVQVKELMTPEMVTIEGDEPIFEGLMLMIQHKISHLVVTESGVPTGVVSEWDWMTFQQRHPASLFQAIESGDSYQTVARLRKEALALIEQLFLEEGRADSLTWLVTEINDRVTARIIELALEKMMEAGRGEPPSGFAWISMGSEGRKEQTVSTDQDNGLIFENVAQKDLELTRKWFLEFAEMAVSGLELCGFPRCKGNTMAVNPELCLSENEWHTVFVRILSNPDPYALLKASIYFDFRCLFGRRELVSLLWENLIGKIQRSRAFLRHMAGNCIEAGRPPIHTVEWKMRRMFRIGQRHIDLKRQAMTPLVMSVRTLALGAGITETHTLDRINSLVEKKQIPETFGDSLNSAYDFIMLLKIRRNLAANETVGNSGNLIHPRHLNPLQFKFLEESLKVIYDLQDFVYTKFGGLPIG